MWSEWKEKMQGEVADRKIKIARKYWPEMKNMREKKLTGEKVRIRFKTVYQRLWLFRIACDTQLLSASWSFENSSLKGQIKELKVFKFFQLACNASEFRTKTFSKNRDTDLYHKIFFIREHYWFYMPSTCFLMSLEGKIFNLD